MCSMQFLSCSMRHKMSKMRRNEQGWSPKDWPTCPRDSKTWVLPALPVSSPSSTGSPCPDMLNPSPMDLGIESLPECQVILSNQSASPCISMRTVISPPRVFSSRTNDNFPAIAPCRETENNVESPSSPIDIASRAVSKIL